MPSETEDRLTSRYISLDIEKRFTEASIRALQKKLSGISAEMNSLREDMPGAAGKLKKSRCQGVIVSHKIKQRKTGE